MRQPIQSADLLDLAEVLADSHPPAGATTVHLRRAVSPAYYALFHELTRAAAARTVGASAGRTDDRFTVSQLYSHGEIRTVSQWVVARSQGRTLPDRIAALLDDPPADLIAVARTFIALQDARHDADYDHRANVTPADTRAQIDASHDAITRLRDLDGERVYDNFPMLLLGARLSVR